MLEKNIQVEKNIDLKIYFEFDIKINEKKAEEKML